jgi:DNA helicase INO80
MAELWALLHFIMPTVFDSHQEFNDWFSKDIENHAENQTALDEHQLQRLHLILKPFMLRRVKLDVEHELAQKVELELECELTFRQKQLYSAIRSHIPINDLLRQGGSALSGGNSETLMNLVMQLRKVCNHPQIFHRRDAVMPFWCASTPDLTAAAKAFPPTSNPISLPFPRALAQRYGLACATSFIDAPPAFGPGWIDVTSPHAAAHFVFHHCRIFDPQHRLLLPAIDALNDDDLGAPPAAISSSAFGFLRLADLTPADLFDYTSRDSFDRLALARTRLAAWPTTADIAHAGSSRRQLLLPQPPAVPWLPSSAAAVYQRYAGLIRTLLILDEPRSPVLASTPALVVSDGAFCRAQYAYPRGLRHRQLVLELSAPLSAIAEPPLLSVPLFSQLVADAGKLRVLDTLLTKLKSEGHRVLIYSQMTKMIDILEDYLTYRQHKYIRLDGSSSLSDRRDLVADFQTKDDIFIFLLSTRAGGLGINLTAADTVIFYDSDWNPTTDAQAMDRAHRLGQTRQVTVYRLVTAGTIEERILKRARQKHTIQSIVIAGSNSVVNSRPSVGGVDVVSLLLDDSELETHQSRRKSTLFS